MSDDILRVDVGNVAGFVDGEMRTCSAGAFRVVVCRVAGRLYAIEDECSHAETTLSDGLLEGHVVTCPLHFAQFDVRDGTHLCPPAYKGVRSFPVVEQPDGTITVEVPATRQAETGLGPPGGMFRTR